MLAAPFTVGVGFYAFYALQPYLLELYGDPNAYGIAGLAAAVVAGAQIVGGLAVPLVRRLFKRRTDALILAGVLTVIFLVLIGLTDSFWVAVVLMTAWGIIAAIEEPIRRASINGLIPSQQRATVLSFDSLIGSAGGVVAQPALGRTADVFGYPASYVASAAIQALAVPFAFLARRENAVSDPIGANGAHADSSGSAAHRNAPLHRMARYIRQYRSVAWVGVHGCPIYRRQRQMRR